MRNNFFYISRSNCEKVVKGESKIKDFLVKPVFIEPLPILGTESLRGLIGCRGTYHTMSDISVCNYFVEFKAGKAGIFTPDGTSFFKILEYKGTEDNKVEISLLRIKKIEENY